MEVAGVNYKYSVTAVAKSHPDHFPLSSTSFSSSASGLTLAPAGGNFLKYKSGLVKLCENPGWLPTALRMKS